jgi:hypothetical protein
VKGWVQLTTTVSLKLKKNVIRKETSIKISGFLGSSKVELLPEIDKTNILQYTLLALLSADAIFGEGEARKKFLKDLAY